ncbi:MAG: class I SAM-dependent methyltransferase [Gemmatimonadaceae bacterium]|nr:class I SAM-dependent methyltransferase [Gemmatimonadaceae bacterium]
MTGKQHWEGVYETKAPDAVSWFQSTAARSLALIRRAAPDHAGPIIDVGGGASVLVEELLDEGYRDVTVLDLAGSALAVARRRIGPASDQVHWMEGDVRSASLPQSHYAVWHDRAVFHFLVDAADREQYRRQLAEALRPDGHAIVATFAEDGPTKCSGLPVRRYSVEELSKEMAPGFRLVASEREGHDTPMGTTQSFIYCLFKRE